MKIFDTPFASRMVIAIGVMLLSGYAHSVRAQSKPTFTSYRQVKIGMSMSEVREKLGDAKEKSDTRDYYEFDNENAQILYESDGTVKTISVNYTGKLENAPTPTAAVGSDITAEDDGSMYKLVRFPSEGYWVSYVRTGGDDPMIIVTLQKMPKE